MRCELGAPGFLPRDPAALRAVLDRHGVRLIGGFVPLVLHDAAQRERTMATARTEAELFAAAGATTFVSTAVVDDGWAPRFPLSAAQWDHLVGMLAELDELCAEHGLDHALHPHVGTLVETSDDVREVLERSAVRWCLDTGHLLIGGYDPAMFAADAAGRIAHVHVKDVRLDLADRARRGELSLIGAVRAGLFCPLGRGDAPIAATIDRLERDGYAGVVRARAGHRSRRSRSRRPARARSPTSGPAPTTCAGCWPGNGQAEGLDNATATSHHNPGGIT